MVRFRRNVQLFPEVVIKRPPICSRQALFVVSCEATARVALSQAAGATGRNVGFFLISVPGSSRGVRNQLRLFVCGFQRFGPPLTAPGFPD